MTGTEVNITVNDICSWLDNFCTDVHGSVYAHAGACITQFDSSNFTVAGLCPYFPANYQSWFQAPLSIYPERLPLTELVSFTCGTHNRESRLCNKCKQGYSPAVYAFSLMCAKCSSNSVAEWALYLLSVLFPITVFYIFVIMFNIRATAPPFTAFVLMCQTYCMVDL